MKLLIAKISSLLVEKIWFALFQKHLQDKRIYKQERLGLYTSLGTPQEMGDLHMFLIIFVTYHRKSINQQCYEYSKASGWQRPNSAMCDTTSYVDVWPSYASIHKK